MRRRRHRSRGRTIGGPVDYPISYFSPSLKLEIVLKSMPMKSQVAEECGRRTLTPTEVDMAGLGSWGLMPSSHGSNGRKIGLRR
jgi:hypothetical protein